MPEKNRPKNFIVEIGVGEVPFPSIGNRVIKRDQIYLGLDNGLMNDKWFKLASRRLMKASSKHKGSLNLVEGDGVALPIKSESVDEVIFCNIFGFPQVQHNLPFIVDEASRVLKKYGVLTVVETSTPYYTPVPLVSAYIIPLGFKPRNVNLDVKDYYSEYLVIMQDSFCISFTRQ